MGDLRHVTNLKLIAVIRASYPELSEMMLEVFIE